MAIDAKASFMSQIEHDCADKLVVKDMNTIMCIISDILEGFDMRERQTWGDGEGEPDDDFLLSFIAAMKVQGKSPKTIERYEYIIKRFMAYAKVPGRKVNVYHIRGWIAHEKERGIADSTLEGNRQVLSSYFGWLFRESLIEKNPMLNVGTIKVAKKQKLVYSDLEMEMLLRSCKNMREKAIIHFLSATGCRVSEMTNLDRKNINLVSCECIVHGKGNKERTVYFDAVTAMILQEYLAKRLDDHPAMFINRMKQRIKPDGIRAILKDIAKRCGLTNVHPHKFRRTRATELTRRGMPLQEVANLLGHEKLDTTMRYVILNREDIKNSYRKYA